MVNFNTKNRILFDTKLEKKACEIRASTVYMNYFFYDITIKWFWDFLTRKLINFRHPSRTTFCLEMEHVLQSLVGGI